MSVVNSENLYDYGRNLIEQSYADCLQTANASKAGFVENCLLGSTDVAGMVRDAHILMRGSPWLSFDF